MRFTDVMNDELASLSTVVNPKDPVRDSARPRPGKLVPALLLVFSLFSAGCVISPYHYWRYTEADVDGASAPVGDIMPGDAYADRRLGGLLLQVGIQARNETALSGDPPYRLHLRVSSGTRGDQRILVHRAEVVSKLDSTQYEISFRSNEPTGSTAMPVTILFTNVAARGSPFYRAEIGTDFSLDLRPAEDERVTVILDLELLDGDQSIRQVYTIEFAPRYKSGLFKSMIFVENSGFPLDYGEWVSVDSSGKAGLS